MKLFVTPFFFLFLVTTLYANEGRELYLEANCEKCHGIDQAYDPKESKAKSLSDLTGWVSSCAGYFNISWFPEEQSQVVEYLNETHYKFKNN